MQTIYKIFLLMILSFGLSTACTQLTEKVEGKLNELNNKAQELDSIVNKELEKVNALDSLIEMESDKVKKLDSLVNQSSSRLDSIANKKIDRIKKMLN